MYSAASAAAQSSCSSSSASSLQSGWDYDVFLSFRGPDTRKNFTGHLYQALVDAGFRTFMDDNELRPGKEIGPELLSAIRQSRISIPIFSKNYASSRWCLDELAKIVECQREMGQFVLPIFFHVEPSDVRKQTGCYGGAFLEHKKRFSEEIVEGWKKALKEIGALKGCELKNIENGNEAKLVKIVVESVRIELKKTLAVVPDYLIGIHSHVDKMLRMLTVESKNVKIIGIHGIGGIGKTTIAKTIYNQICHHYETCSFLADVRETCQQPRGIISLQNQLIYDILKQKDLLVISIDGGVNVIKERFRSKKVLIVIDDVDQSNQLNVLAANCDWFGLGSRIIITSRDEQIFITYGVNEIYKPNEMDFDQSLKLFSKHAFGRSQPPADYMELSRNVVHTTGGLPLSLEVLGSSLIRKGISEWNDTLQKLKKIPHPEVQKKLKISYDGLNYEEKQIFLDIACFFNGMDKRNVIHIWDDFFPEVGINSLLRKSLLKIGDNNELRMHDQLRDLGREIVCQENLKEPGKRSRLPSHAEAFDIVDKQEGTRKIEGLYLNFNHCFEDELDRHLTNKGFAALLRLRVLQVNYADFVGNFEHLFKELRWLSWIGSPREFKATNFYLEKLTVLDLSCSKVTEDWKGWTEIKMANLKVIILTSCLSLVKTPDFSAFWMLEKLILDHCRQLVELDKSIGHIKSLAFLDMSWCVTLKRLPCLKNLRHLATLVLFHCEKLAEIDGFEDLDCLILLDLSWCVSLESLPCLTNLRKLNKLDLTHCEKLVEIQGLEGLDSLSELDMSWCISLKRLPFLKNLGSLAKLELPHCEKLVEIRGLEDLDSLSLLNMWWCLSLETLPYLKNLISLTKIDLTHCEKLAEIQGLEGLDSLSELDMSWCISLKRLPFLKNLGSLAKLELPHCEKLVEIRGLEDLDSLSLLNMWWCLSLETLPYLKNLISLTKIDLTHCEKLAEIQGLEGLDSLSELDMSWCISLKRLPFLKNLGSLAKLELPHCEKLVEIRGLEDLGSLSLLNMWWCLSLETLPYLKNLISLTKIDLTHCEKLAEIQGLEGLDSLSELDMSWCVSLKRLPYLKNLRSLTTLVLLHCEKLAEIDGFAGLDCLILLDLSWCVSLETLPYLKNLRNLTKIDLSHCKKLTEVPGIDRLESLEILKMVGCVSLERLPDLSNLKTLKQLDTTNCEKLSEIKAI